MKVFETLYSRTNTGAIQTWVITVKDNYYFTTSGQINGVKTTSAPVVCEGKNFGKTNATTDEDQALLEAQSKFDKRLKTGYFKSVEQIDNPYFIEPMLAQPLAKVKKGIHYPAMLQVKYNGGRCIATKDGLFTRKGERYETVPHIANSLAPLFIENPNLVLDGELYNYERRQKLNELMSLIRRTKHIEQSDLDASRELVKYYVYDGYGINATTESTAYSNRKAEIDEAIDSLPYIEKVETILVHSKEELDKHYNEFLADGQEGGIVRYGSNIYEHKRSNNLIKLKNTDDAEFLITGISQGKGNWAGVAKIIHCRMDNGKDFDATFKGTMEEALICLTNKEKYIGNKYTIFYNGLTGLGTPNYAQFDWNNSVNVKAK